ADELDHPPLHLRGLLLVPVDQRLPEVEDHRLYRLRRAYACTDDLSTSQVRRTSSSVVRSLPIASRITSCPRSIVAATKTSPVAVARCASAWFPPPRCRKHTVENGCGA